MDQEVYLKNVTQIGTPGPSGKIYIADDAYERLHMDDYRDIRVFVLMGHTECSAGKYTTFIEAAITVDDISFIRNIPVWTNKVWNRIYTEIKRAYDQMIIVGWAMDQKGVVPAVTHELESIHREHFGGANQALLLMDSEQQEERFYLSRNNHLYAKDGFYIYYSCGRPKEQSQVQLELPPEAKTARALNNDNQHHRRSPDGWNIGREVTESTQDDTESVNEHSTEFSGTHGLYRERQKPEEGSYRNQAGKVISSQGNRTQPGAARGQYRAMMAAQRSRRSNQSAGKFNVAAAAVTVALIAGIAVTGIRRDPDRAAQMDKWIETISNSVRGSSGDEGTANSEYVIHFTTEELLDSEVNPDSEESMDLEENSDFAEETSDSTEGGEADSTETAADTDADAQQTSGDVIPVEEIN